MGINSTPRNWVSGETVTAAEMNTEIRDFAVGVQAGWVSDFRSSAAIWTAASGTNTLADGTLVAATRQVGKTVDWQVRLIMGAGTSFAAGGWQLVPPLPIKTTYMANVSCRGYDASLSANSGWSFGVDASTLFAIKCPPTTQPNADRVVSSTVPFTWATGDVLILTARYETS